jgi:hypothetical protein
LPVASVANGLTATIPETIAWQVDLRTRELLRGLPRGAVGTRFVVQVAQVVAVERVLSDWADGRMEAFLGASLDPRERTALAGAGRVLSAGVYEQLVAQGRERPEIAGLIPPVAGVPARTRPVLEEAYQALSGFAPVVEWVVASGLPAARSALLLGAVWNVLVDNCVSRTLADVPAQTVRAARQELRRYGERALCVTPVAGRFVTMQVWQAFTRELTDSRMRNWAAERADIFAQEGGRLLTRWLAVPSYQIPPRAPEVDEHFEEDLRPAIGGAVMNLVYLMTWVARAKWRRVFGSSGSEQVYAVPLSEVVPHARLAATVPTPFAAAMRAWTGQILQHLPEDTAGPFEARLAAAGVATSYLKYEGGLTVGERTSLAALRDVLVRELNGGLVDLGRARIRPMLVADAVGQDVDATFNRLPQSVGEVLRGLTPAAIRVATAGWPVEIAIPLLYVLQDALVIPAVNLVLPGAPAIAVEVARQELAELWGQLGSRRARAVPATSESGWRRLVEQLQAPDAIR